MSDQKTVYSGHKGSRSSSGRANRAKRGKRPLNRYVLETSSNERFSASSKKVDLDKDIDDIDVDGSFGYRFINLIPFLMLLSQLVVCKKCHSNVVFEEKSRRGLGFKIAVKCNKCKVEEINSSPIVRGNAYDKLQISISYAFVGDWITWHRKILCVHGITTSNISFVLR